MSIPGHDGAYGLIQIGHVQFEFDGGVHRQQAVIEITIGGQDVTAIGIGLDARHIAGANQCRNAIVIAHSIRLDVTQPVARTGIPSCDATRFIGPEIAVGLAHADPQLIAAHILHADDRELAIEARGRVECGQFLTAVDIVAEDARGRLVLPLSLATIAVAIVTGGIVDAIDVDREIAALGRGLQIMEDLIDADQLLRCESTH